MQYLILTSTTEHLVVTWTPAQDDEYDDMDHNFMMVMTKLVFSKSKGRGCSLEFSPVSLSGVTLWSHSGELDE